MATTCARHVTQAEVVYYHTVICHFDCVGRVEIPVPYAGNCRDLNRELAIFPWSNHNHASSYLPSPSLLPPILFTFSLPSYPSPSSPFSRFPDVILYAIWDILTPTSPRQTFDTLIQGGSLPTPLPSSPWSRELHALVHRGRAIQIFADSQVQHISVASRSPARLGRLKSSLISAKMDPTLRSARTTTTTSQTPAQTSTFPPSTSTVDPSANLSNPRAQPPNPFTIPSETISQTLSAPLQSTSACAQEAAMSQTQPLSQTLNDPSRRPGLPVSSRSGSSASVPRSETAPANQSATAVYPHQVNGLGGPTATAPFLQDFSLVAEAAKRAQMSIVMRDLESVTL